ncbi:hypothetical protein U27_00800 [Candidatus Vecturithrix granuli]|uniref:Uncharacterized protein n=1 Tax=Vecturithrix granuli TaxID=1499967 RepID=A0A081C8J7_VECG1|nr:hypothetical protein U27_00800 [Candidatus Vecturithrix granuli]
MKFLLYEDRFADDFAKINYGWLEQFRLIEKEDRKYLEAVLKVCR